MMPMAFWASFWPWVKDMAAALTSCALRKTTFTLCPEKWRTIHRMIRMSSMPTMKPMAGRDDDEGADLLELLGVEGAEARVGDDGSGQAAEQGVAGAGGDAEPPGEQIPRDGRHEGGRDDGRDHVLAIGDALGDGGGHGGAQPGPRRN